MKSLGISDGQNSKIPFKLRLTRDIAERLLPFVFLFNGLINHFRNQNMHTFHLGNAFYDDLDLLNFKNFRPSAPPWGAEGKGGRG